MKQKQIRGVAEAVLEYNGQNRDNPVFVVADRIVFFRFREDYRTGNS